MFAPLVLLALTAAPGPRALPDADVALFVPSLTAAQPELAFFTRLGQASALLDPRGWSTDFHPLVPVDLTRPPSFTEVGLDPTGAASWSVRGGLKLTCTEVSDGARFEKAAQARLQTAGDPWSAKVGASVLHGVKVDGRMPAGEVVVGRTGCAAAGPDAERTLRYAAGWLSATWPTSQSLHGLKGRLFVVSPSAVAGLRASGDHLTVDGRGARRVALEPGHAATYALPTSGLLRARATFTPAALAQTARRVLAQLCARCTDAKLGALEHTLATELTGDALLRVDRFEPRGPLASPGGQFSALRLGAVAKVRSAAKVRAALDALVPHTGEEGAPRWSVPLRGGTLEVGLRGDALYLSNDATARDRALTAAEGRARPAHALELAVDPKLLAAGMGRISLLDALSNRRLAAAFAVATEGLPVLHASRALTGWADPAGSALRFGGVWTLLPPVTR